MTDDLDLIEFDEVLTLALAGSAAADAPPPRSTVRAALMRRVHESQDPSGFSFNWANDDRWLPHPIAGIRMKILTLNKQRGYATLLLDVAPGTRFPAHHHGGAEECYVVSGSLFTCGRRLEAGDFVHADADTDHGELWTEEGCRVILIVPPEEHLPPSFLA
jgi:anti-sigma factor ChrR (cupin superfamily)